MTIFGTTTGSTSGNQVLGGLSTSYQMDAGRFSVSPFLNLDYIKTNFKGYEESGSTLLEFRFSDRRASSFTSSLGGRVSTTYGYSWGILIPSARLAAVHEFQNNSQQIYSELVITPGTGMSVTTDAPDRNYLNIGLGVAVALNGGSQLFLDYEKRTQDRLLSSWAVSLGGLFEF
jgi:outer membrane autotransporter protein